MKSRPTYGALRPVARASRHLIAAQPKAVKAVLGMLDQAQARGSDIAGRVEVVLVAAQTSDAAATLRDRGVTVHAADKDGADPQVLALDTLDRLLTGARMGTRLYVAGSEGFIGHVVKLATEHGIDRSAIVSEHAGSRARRVQCVHCKATQEAVTTSFVECVACGLLLLVRDHYSHRLAAFQGVCANAEDPLERPQPVEVFS